jgi:NO-binding membrane sensor protein with MHYT domain
MLAVFDFTYGPLNPVLAFIACGGGVFLALRSTSRALDRSRSARAQWLLMGGVTLGAVGFWSMHMIALLGFTIRGDTVYYSIPLTLASLLVAIVTATAGLMIVGFRPQGYAALTGAGLITGAGLVGMQYLGFASLRTPARLSYETVLVIVSIVLGFVAAFFVLAAAVRVRQTGPTAAAALISGVVLLVMHYTGMMAIQAHRPDHPVAIFMGGPDSTIAQSFMLPLILGIGTLCFLVSAAIALWPGAEEIRYDAALLDHIGKRNQRASASLSAAGVTLRPPGRGGRSTAPGNQGNQANQWTPPPRAPAPRSPAAGPPARPGPGTGPHPQRTPPAGTPAQRAPNGGGPLQEEPGTGPLPIRIPRSTPPRHQRGPATGPRTQWADGRPAEEDEPTSWSFAELQLRKPPEPR